MNPVPNRTLADDMITAPSGSVTYVLYLIKMRLFPFGRRTCYTLSPWHLMSRDSCKSVLRRVLAISHTDGTYVAHRFSLFTRENETKNKTLANDEEGGTGWEGNQITNALVFLLSVDLCILHSVWNDNVSHVINYHQSCISDCMFIIF